ncbi:MAG: phosphonate ABC transporter substrate-binding protein [Polaromonas sp.]|uniref:phosphonate ABC transporter substrate-binding protein n=1 Tax=Polaromonas sp. TaxID=1869339 RepID=UPI0040367B81|nr:phosphonate ABC transporter substrate-binding protein [Polaromonas sp.]
MLKKLLTGLAAATLLALAPAHAQDLKEINFGIISTESSQNLKSDWQPLLDDMAKKTGYKVNAFFAPDYAGIIEGMRFGKVHLAWYGNKSAMEAVDRAGGEVFAQMVNADGTQGYYSHFVVHKDSPLKTLDDVLKNAKSLSFGNGDPNSTSGFLVPSYYVFAQNKIDARTAFRVSRSANHETNALAAVNKQVDVAVTNSETMDKIKDRMPEKYKDIRIVWTSPLIPLDPLVMRKDLPATTQQKLKDFFYTYGQGGQQEKDVMMKISKLSAFKPSTNAQLIPIRQLELFKERNKFEADANLPGAEKQARVAEIDRKLAELAKN